MTMLPDLNHSVPQPNGDDRIGPGRGDPERDKIAT